ncbi:hypothetical protein DFH07DRAFT_963607 [Mycena maculata]|uniref:DUF6533 domain-containing protein n=1 Tax=Mycena maculata TaxID=230809 RepID=A0AAD7IML7_9AGAR|nr:hypothetical protein DFH07DRAFT_963607 [Mycena maculata]
MATIFLDDITVAQDQRLRRSIFLAALVVVAYDHILTLGSEVTHIWSQPVKRGSAFFLLARYTALLSNFGMVAFFFGDFSAEVFFVGCTLALRVCAIYGFNRRVFVPLSIAAVITVTLGAWAVVGPDSTLETSLPGCHIPISKTQAIRESSPWSLAKVTYSPTGVAAAWEAQLICDVIILGLTLRRALTYHRTVGLGSGSLLPIMVRDGAVYFGMMCTVNLANIVMLHSGDPLTAGTLAWFASAISVTMVSRLMLNLHDAANGSFADGFIRPNTEHELGVLPFRQPGLTGPSGGYEIHE